MTDLSDDKLAIKCLTSTVTALQEQLEDIKEVLARMFGGEPRQLELRQGDAFSITSDFRPLLRAVGGTWAELVDRVEAGEKERRSNELASKVSRDEINERWKVPGMLRSMAASA